MKTFATAELPPVQKRAITSVIKAELEIAGEYDNDAELIITHENKISDRQATTIMRLLYPKHIVTAIEVSEV